MVLIRRLGVLALNVFALPSLLGSRRFSVQAQLESCADIGCPSLEGDCSLPDLGGQSLSWLGASRFQTQLSSNPLSWTIGDTPRISATGDAAEDALVFYLGQPPTLNLRDNTSVMACAIFFDGVAPHLKFNHSKDAVNDMTTRGTCDDALTTQCVSDWTRQAANVTAQLAGDDFTCQVLADSLRADPPRSCKAVKGSWGSVQARNISGSTMPVFTSTDSCNPTINSTYSATQVAIINGKKGELFTAITPVLTTIILSGRDVESRTEVHLNCLKLINDALSSDSVFEGSSSHLRSPDLALWIACCLVALSWLY